MIFISIKIFCVWRRKILLNKFHVVFTTEYSQIFYFLQTLIHFHIHKQLSQHVFPTSSGYAQQGDFHSYLLILKQQKLEICGKIIRVLIFIDLIYLYSNYFFQNFVSSTLVTLQFLLRVRYNDINNFEQIVKLIIVLQWSTRQKFYFKLYFLLQNTYLSLLIP